MKLIPSRIIEARKRRNLTQRALAEALGVTVQAVSQWENGKTDASPRLARLSAALHCDTGFLTGTTSLPAFEEEEQEEDERTSIIELNYIAPLIEVDYFPQYMTFFANKDIPPSSVNLSSTVDPVGRLFAVRTTEDTENYKKGDILIFDNGIEAMPGDLAAMIVLKGSISQMIQMGNGNHLLDNAGGTIAKVESQYDNVSAVHPAIMKDEKSGSATVKAVIVVGTLVEHRTFRSPPT